MNNGHHSGGLNPRPLSHESSALTTRPRLFALYGGKLIRDYDLASSKSRKLISEIDLSRFLNAERIFLLLNKELFNLIDNYNFKLNSILLQ